MRRLLIKLCNLVLVALLGASAALAFPPYGHSWLIFLVLSLFCGLLDEPLKRRGFSFGFLFYLAAAWGFIQHWFSYYFRMNLHCGYLLAYLLSFLVCVYVALYIGLLAWSYQKLRLKSAAANLLLLLPALWTLSELIRGEIFPRSWYVLAYTQVDNLLFRGYFPLLGMYFVSWLMVMLAGLVVYAYTQRRYLIPGLVLLFFVAGSYALSFFHYTTKSGAAVKFALVQPNVMSSMDFEYPLVVKLEQIVSQQIAANPAEVYVLPETVFGTRLENLTPGYLNLLKQQISSRRAVLLFGSPFLAASGQEQAGSLQMDSSSTGFVYIKRNLVPWGEHDPLVGTFLEPLSRQIAGRNIELLPGPEVQEAATVFSQKIAFNICYENSINDFVAYSARDASIILNLSDLSWYGDTEMLDASLQFSQARALENQRYFLQDADTGITAVINPQGVIESRLAKFSSATLLATVQGYTGQTPFQRWGNYPIWLICLLTILLFCGLKLQRYCQYK